MKRIVTAAVLAAALTTPAGAAGCPPINLRDYWILAEIVNPGTGERDVFRVDCSDQEPLLCWQDQKPNLTLWKAYRGRIEAQEAGRPAGPWPAHIKLGVEPLMAGFVGYLTFAGGGFAVTGDVRDRAYKWAPFSELRSPAGFSIPISTVRGGKRVDNSDVRLTLWLVTPEELAERDAAADTPAAKPAKPAKTSPRPPSARGKGG